MTSRQVLRLPADSGCIRFTRATVRFLPPRRRLRRPPGHRRRPRGRPPDRRPARRQHHDPPQRRPHDRARERDDARRPGRPRRAQLPPLRRWEAEDQQHTEAAGHAPCHTDPGRVRRGRGRLAPTSARAPRRLRASRAERPGARAAARRACGRRSARTPAAAPRRGSGSAHGRGEVLVEVVEEVEHRGAVGATSLSSPTAHASLESASGSEKSTRANARPIVAVRCARRGRAAGRGLSGVGPGAGPRSSGSSRSSTAPSARPSPRAAARRSARPAVRSASSAWRRRAGCHRASRSRTRRWPAGTARTWR